MAAAGGVEELRRRAARPAPVTLGAGRRLVLGEGLGALFPEGLAQGTTVAVGGPPGWGVSTLVLGLLAGPTRRGEWAAVVGAPALGAVAAAGLGVRLDRLALVPDPGRQWPVVVAALLDAMVVVAVAAPARVRVADASALRARARERGAVLVVWGMDGAWPGAERHVRIVRSTWEGVGQGDGHLRARRVTVTVGGRGAAARERRQELWLPSADGPIRAAAGEEEVVAVDPVAVDPVAVDPVAVREAG